MPDDTKQNGGASQFRRQLIATLAGAFIGLFSSASITLFQWLTQTREKRYQERTEAISQFVAALYGATSMQSRLMHLANRCSYLAARAGKLATATQASGEDVITDSKELLNESWQLESEIVEQWGEFAKSNQAISSAYYRLLRAVGDVPPLGFGPFPEQSVTWNSMSGTLHSQELIKMAEGFNGMAAQYKLAADNLGKWANKWIIDAAGLELRFRN